MTWQQMDPHYIQNEHRYRVSKNQAGEHTRYSAWAPNKNTSGYQSLGVKNTAKEAMQLCEQHHNNTPPATP